MNEMDKLRKIASGKNNYQQPVSSEELEYLDALVHAVQGALDPLFKGHGNAVLVALACALIKNLSPKNLRDFDGFISAGLHGLHQGRLDRESARNGKR